MHHPAADTLFSLLPAIDVSLIGHPISPCCFQAHSANVFVWFLAIWLYEEDNTWGKQFFWSMEASVHKHWLLTDSPTKRWFPTIHRIVFDVDVDVSSLNFSSSASKPTVTLKPPFYYGAGSSCGFKTAPFSQLVSVCMCKDQTSVQHECTERTTGVFYIHVWGNVQIMADFFSSITTSQFYMRMFVEFYIFW